MAKVKIPDDFYTFTYNTLNYLCHKSCTVSDNVFTNDKVVRYINISNKVIDDLRRICDMNDEIEEKTYFVNNEFNDLIFYISSNFSVYLHNAGICIKLFRNASYFLKYLAENYPDCMRNNEIKIALKD
jgi:hypothetical protein